MEENDNWESVSSRKLEANRRNAQLSTGPRSDEGKKRSRLNAFKHGILASALLITDGEGAEDVAEFDELVGALSRDLAPVGTLEEILIERIAICCWRQKRALRCEAGLIRRRYADSLESIEISPSYESGKIKEHLALPKSADVDRILRYETTIQRQLVHAIDQLERLQRTRKGEHVPAPLSVQLSSDR